MLLNAVAARSRGSSRHSRAGSRRHPEELAQHAAAAGLWRKALQYYGQAGKAALDRSATIEGFALTAKAIKAGEHMAEIRKHGLLSSNSTRHAGGRISRSGTRLGSPPSSRPRRASAAQFGLDRMSCQLQAQRAHVETIYGGTTRNAIRYGRDAARIAERLKDGLASVARFVLGLSFLFGGQLAFKVAELIVDANLCCGLRMAAVGTSGTLAADGLAVLGDALAQLGHWDDALTHGTATRPSPVKRAFLST